MNSNWAAENLQVIRTLMERSAVYRRALAPIMLLAGLLGCAAAAVGFLAHLRSDAGFIELWVGTSVIAGAGAFLLMRQQAIKDREPFWSPPARRIVQAIAPPLIVGAVATLLFVIEPAADGLAPILLAPVWMALYGCALHAAGFFIPRGIKWLGWIFVACGSGLLLCLFAGVAVFGRQPEGSYLAMGATFGLLHLAYGVYLYFTEQRRSET